MSSLLHDFNYYIVNLFKPWENKPADLVGNAWFKKGFTKEKQILSCFNVIIINWSCSCSCWICDTFTCHQIWHDYWGAGFIIPSKYMANKKIRVGKQKITTRQTVNHKAKGEENNKI